MNRTFLQACRGEPVDYVPVWFMRQAGRTDPDYLKIKEKYSLLDICLQPQLAAEVTMMPVRKLGVDAAILYSDIMNPVASIGIDFDIVPEVGPVINNPIRSLHDVNQLRPIDVDRHLSHVMETIRILDEALDVPLITFAGAPFTLASYLIEGRPSRNYYRTKQMMYSAPDVWHKLMKKLGDMVITYLQAQIAAGAKAIQVFDSWAGALAPQDYRHYVLPSVVRIFEAVGGREVPAIYFPGVGSGELLSSLKGLRADVIGLDWKVPLSEGRRRTGGAFAIQGNLDPTVLMAPLAVIEAYAKEIIDDGMRQPGFIFNVGHGLFPQVPLEHVQGLTAFVQQYSRQKMARRVAEGS